MAGQLGYGARVAGLDRAVSHCMQEGRSCAVGTMVPIPSLTQVPAGVQVNPNGGAIALGHALGCTGARMTATLLHEMKRRGRGARFGVVSMCIGSGMGAAAVYEVGDYVDPAAHVMSTKQQGFLSKDAM
jgi:acetyl-CoA acetyltransferase